MAQGNRASGDTWGVVNLDPICEELGYRGRYHLTQMTLTIYASFLFVIPFMNYVFIGYEPDYQCNELNVTQLDDYLPDNVTNFILHDVKYQKCSIDVTVNTSATSSTHSLPCVAGVNFSMPSHTSFLTEWSLVCDKSNLNELAQLAFFGGNAAGSLMTSILADRYGRRRVYVTNAVGNMLALVITTFMPSFNLFLAGRIIMGVFSVGMVHVAYTMFTELLPSQWRCMASVMDSFMFSAASILMAILAYCLQGLSWRYLSLAFTSLFAFTLILPWFLEESLYWLVATGDIAEAEEVLRRACRMNGKDFGKIKAMLEKQIPTNSNPDDRDESLLTHINEDTMPETSGEETNMETTNEKKLNAGAMDVGAKMVEGVSAEETVMRSSQSNLARVHDAGNARREGTSKDQQQQTEVMSAKYTILDLFRHRVVLVPFLVTVLVWTSSNLYFISVLLGSANLSGNRFLNFGLLNLQNIPSTIVSLFLMKRFNRRPLAFMYGMLSGIFLLVSVGLIGLGGREGLTLTLATVAQYAGMFALNGTYVLLFVYFMEVYPTSMRAVGSGAASTMITLTIMVSPFLLQWAEDTPWAPGVVVGCMCCLASLSIWFLPETRNRKLPDTIEEIKAWKKKEPVV